MCLEEIILTSEIYKKWIDDGHRNGYTSDKTNKWNVSGRI